MNRVMLVRTVLLNVQRIVPLPTSVTLGFVMQHLENVSLDVRTAHLEIDVKSDALISTNIAKDVLLQSVAVQCVMSVYLIFTKGVRNVCRAITGAD